MALARTSAAVMAVFNAALRHHDLSPTARQALAILEGTDGPLSPTTISERVLVTTASMSSLLDTLEGRGLITRLPHADDRRKQSVAITEEGQRVVDAFLPDVVALQTAMMTALSETERRQLQRYLTAIRDAAATIDTDAVIAAAGPRVTPARRGTKR